MDARRYVVVVLLVAVVFAAAPSQAGHAVVSVEPGARADAVTYGGVRYRSFANGAPAEIYEGRDIDPFPADMVTQDLTWVRPGANQVMFSFDAAAGRLITQVNANSPLVYEGFAPAAVNMLQIVVLDHDGNGTLAFADVVVNGTALGSFASATPTQQAGCVTTSPVFPYGLCTWSVTGLELDGGFTLRASLVLSERFSLCEECSKVEVRLGYVETDDAEGPDVLNVQSDSPVARTGSVVNVLAVADDRARGGSPIRSADLRVGDGDWQPMAAVDGNFDGVMELVASAAGVPSAAGAYDVCIRATDERGNRGRPACTAVVAFDPEGGSVTAGGWFQPQGGASGGGKVTFGITARYPKGATVPSGSVEIQFHNDVNFHADALDWLLVEDGRRAHLRGTGTVNGVAGFAFEVWLDASERGSIDVRIWDPTSEVTRFRTIQGQKLGGGAIALHPAKR